LTILEITAEEKSIQTVKVLPCRP